MNVLIMFSMSLEYKIRQLRGTKQLSGLDTEHERYSVRDRKVGAKGHADSLVSESSHIPQVGQKFIDFCPLINLTSLRQPTLVGRIGFGRLVMFAYSSSLYRRAVEVPRNMMFI